MQKRIEMKRIVVRVPDRLYLAVLKAANKKGVGIQRFCEDTLVEATEGKRR